jgi:hypothetical protein
MSRHWNEDWRKIIAGVPFRVRHGRKSPTDLVLEWLTPEMEWRAVPMLAGGVIADFWAENEDDLYPPPAQGGTKYMRYIRQAIEEGWVVADAQLEAEKRRKREREEGHG